jgi:hypothetical protein
MADEEVRILAGRLCATHSAVEICGTTLSKLEDDLRATPIDSHTNVQETRCTMRYSNRIADAQSFTSQKAPSEQTLHQGPSCMNGSRGARPHRSAP